MTFHTIIFGDARAMPEVADQSVHLIVTSPPYWQIKDYGARDQIGFHDDYRAYIANLNLVWEECARVLHEGCRLCVNVGDQFCRAAHYGRYKVIPIREEIVGFCEKQLGLDYMGAIIWQKVTTCNTSGGATIMGSFPFPRNGIIKIDYEFILTFKKPGKPPAPPSPEAKEAARMTTEEWNEYFYGHWNFPGVRQGEHPAAFPLELPRRLIRMFTFPGETVLDPFLGSGTTSVAAKELGRRSIGYELNPEFRSILETRLECSGDLLNPNESSQVEFLVQRALPSDFTQRIQQWSMPRAASPPPIERKKQPPKPFIERLDQALKPLIEQEDYSSRRDKSRAPRPEREMPRMEFACDDCSIILHDDREIPLLGVAPWPKEEQPEDARDQGSKHLYTMIGGGGLTLSNDAGPLEDGADEPAYVHLSNKKFVNARMIHDGFARADRSRAYRHRARFEKYEAEARAKGRGLWGKGDAE